MREILKSKRPEYDEIIKEVLGGEEKNPKELKKKVKKRMVKRGRTFSDSTYYNRLKNLVKRKRARAEQK